MDPVATALAVGAQGAVRREQESWVPVGWAEWKHDGMWAEEGADQGRRAWCEAARPRAEMRQRVFRSFNSPGTVSDVSEELLLYL